jgi:hypothetical protein
MNNFKKQLYRRQESIELTLIPVSANQIEATLPDDIIIQVRSNTNWSVGATADWFSFRTNTQSGNGDGVFSLNIESNDTSSSRNYQLYVTANDGVDTFTVVFSMTQFGQADDGPDPGTLSILPTARLTTSAGETYGISVTSNTSWTVSKDRTWIDLGGVTSGNGSPTIDVTTSPNGGDSDRSGTITFTAVGIEPVKHEVSQKGSSGDNQP